MFQHWREHGVRTPATTDREPTRCEALPVIWEKKKDFDDRFAKLVADAKAAQTAITDEKSFKAKFPDVAGNCGGCHKIYREQK